MAKKNSGVKNKASSKPASRKTKTKAGESTKKKEIASNQTSGVQIDIHCKYDELVEPGKLKPHPANPNRHPESQINLLARIMSEHGIRWPISVSNRSGFIVSGHGRLMAAQALELDKFPVVYQDFKSESEELAVLVADNKIAELAETDGSKMGDIIVELDQVNYPMELTALSTEEVKYYVEGPTSMSVPVKKNASALNAVTNGRKNEDISDRWLRLYRLSFMRNAA